MKISIKYNLQPSIVSMLDPYGSVVSKNALPATCGASTLNEAKLSLDHDFITSVLHVECLNTTRDGSY